MNYKRRPIKTEKEATEVTNYLIETTMSTLKIDREEATKRVNALLKTDIMNGFNPDKPAHQIAVDMFMQIPSSDYERLKINN
ncbi:hypothetical protein ACX0G7_09805 [Flavitalea antarctica]